MTIETMTFTCAWKGCCKEVHYDEILCAEHDELVVNTCSTMDHMTAMPNEKWNTRRILNIKER